jgi:hypothetical protein
MTIIDNFNFVLTDVECPESTQAKMFASPQFMDFIVQYDTAKFSLTPQTPHGDANSRLA